MFNISFKKTSILVLFLLALSNLCTGQYFIKLEHPPTGTTSPKKINCIDFHPNGKNILTAGSPYGKVFVWDLSEGKLEKVIQCTSNTPGAIYSPSGKYIATNEWNKIVTIYKSDDYSIVHRFQHDNFVPKSPAAMLPAASSIQFSPDGKKLIVCYFDVTFVWDVATGTLLKRYDYPHAAVKDMPFLPDGINIFFEYGNEKWLLNIENGTKIKTEILGHPIGISTDSKTIIVVCTNTIQYWDEKAETLLREEPYDNPILQARDFSPDMRFMLSANPGNITIRKNYDKSTVLNISSAVNKGVFTEGSSAVKFSKDMNYAAVAAQGDVYVFPIKDLVSRAKNAEQF